MLELIVIFEILLDFTLLVSFPLDWRQLGYLFGVKIGIL
jgi:hypothetical protein